MNFKITISKEYITKDGGYARENDLYVQRVEAIDIARIADIVNKVELAHALSKQNAEGLQDIIDIVEGK